MPSPLPSPNALAVLTERLETLLQSRVTGLRKDALFW